jgi:hypothetical protein
LNELSHLRIVREVPEHVPEQLAPLELLLVAAVAAQPAAEFLVDALNFRGPESSEPK